jgi:EAL domain-containing protein (putative c-di-GMP-specific phosphodiesterase class I)
MLKHCRLTPWGWPRTQRNKNGAPERNRELRDVDTITQTKTTSARTTSAKKALGKTTSEKSAKTCAKKAKAASLDDLVVPAARPVHSEALIKRALAAIRTHLGMDVSYVSQFEADRTILRVVDAPGLEHLVKQGDSRPLDEVCCPHVLEGGLPQLMPDTPAEPVTKAMPITQAIPVGKHVCVPIRMPDGSTYGMFCCFGFSADPSLRERDLQTLRAFADLAGFEIARDVAAAKAANDKEYRIRKAIDNKEISTLYQPIWRLENPRPLGFECLSRFSAAPGHSPQCWFAEAAEVGLGAQLELAAAELGLAVLHRLPPDMYLSVNVAPQTILDSDFPTLLQDKPVGRIVLEITEHTHVRDYDRLLDILAPLRRRGMRVAVDDAGAGYASLQHILLIQPDLIKLDVALTRHVDLDPARKALASALVSFARDTGSRIIAEGVETASELSTLRAIGIAKAQGYFLGRPMVFDAAMRMIERGQRVVGRVA